MGTLSLMKDLDLLPTPLGQLVADALAMIKPVIASLGLFAASIVIRMIASKALAGEEQDAKAEAQATMAFFSCTVGFAVPVSALAAKDWGLVVAIVILAVLSKIATGIFAGKPTEKGYGLQVLQVGAAMVGRGE